MKRRFPVERAPALLPWWFEEETAYANDKYGDHNPQLAALQPGGLRPDGQAYGEHISYFSRARHFGTYPDDAMLLLKTSQALGKFANSGRSLLRVLLSKNDNAPRAHADVKTYLIASTLGKDLGDGLPAPSTTEAFDAIWEESINPRLATIADAIDENYLQTAEALATDLLSEQIKLFIGHASMAGFMAKPGVSSTYEEGELVAWEIPGTLGD